MRVIVVIYVWSDTVIYEFPIDLWDEKKISERLAFPSLVLSCKINRGINSEPLPIYNRPKSLRSISRHRHWAPASRGPAWSTRALNYAWARVACCHGLELVMIREPAVSRQFSETVTGATVNFRPQRDRSLATFRLRPWISCLFVQTSIATSMQASNYALVEQEQKSTVSTHDVKSAFYREKSAGKL